MQFQRSIFFLLIIYLFFAGQITAQTPCNELGQNPGTAFPVCGTSTFSIASVPICGDRRVPGPCFATPLTDKNPYWYKFTCFTAGTLGLLITPNTISDDYDWQVFDITNANPNDVYTNANLFVACNWSGDGGLTGASNAGTKTAQCDGLGVPRFSSMPTLIQGHQYLLLISHFSDSQSGYALTFGGGTASITDPIDPALQNAKAACDGTKISIKLNKKMKCSSLAANGTDFSISPAIAPIVSATGVGCSTSFDMDSIVITLGNNLLPGNYTVKIETGTDGNNLLDNCDRGIPTGQTLPVTVYPVTATPMDSLTKVGCAPFELQLVFKDLINCQSIAADGSDFIISGTSTVVVASAAGVCDATSKLTKIIKVRLSKPIEINGTFQLILKTGTDGNTIINECGMQTLAGSFLNFSTKDTVSALFNYNINYGCLADTVAYIHDGRNGVNSWQWNFDNAVKSISKDTTLIYYNFTQKTAQLIVTNGTCADTANAILLLNNHVTAAFLSTAVVCPGDPAIFTDTSVGPVTNWSWNFGNGNVSTQKITVPQFYPSSNIVKDVPIQLIVQNNIGCADTATKTIRVVGNCYIAVPKAFSPNNDGLNDFLFPNNAYKAKDLLFRIYNRLGQLVFETQDWTTKWDGTFKGAPQDTGTFVWILSYTNIDTGKRFELKGSTLLLR